MSKLQKPKTIKYHWYLDFIKLLHVCAFNTVIMHVANVLLLTHAHTTVDSENQSSADLMLLVDCFFAEILLNHCNVEPCKRIISSHVKLTICSYANTQSNSNTKTTVQYGSTI